MKDTFEDTFNNTFDVIFYLYLLPYWPIMSNLHYTELTHIASQSLLYPVQAVRRDSSFLFLASYVSRICSHSKFDLPPVRCLTSL